MEDENGLESIVSFLNDKKFVEKHLNSIVNVFGTETRIIKLLISNLTGLNKHNDALFKKICQQLKFNLIESIFTITNKVETKSDINFSAYLFLAKMCNENELENEFNKILKKYENYLKQCADEFNNQDSENIQRLR